jgi:hypothetical protein
VLNDAFRWDSPFPRTGRNLYCGFYYTKSIVEGSRDFLHEAPNRSACAAFSEESRVRLANAGKLQPSGCCVGSRFKS